ncbi:MAG TPA: type II secretion system protein GspM [Candidatus Binataceae bacterium]|jgi:hypothetical protein|nr:type II secretion system protein GspM [Candidatus Binataceae bacterium]
MLERWRNLIPRATMPDPLRRLPGKLAELLEPLRPYYDRAAATVAPAWHRARTYYEHREPREKLLLNVAGGVLGLLLVYSLIYSPIVNLRDSLADSVATRRQDLVDIRSMMRSYDRVRAELAAAQQRTVPNPKTFSLFSIIEQTLTRSVTRDHIGSISPTDHEVPGGFREYSVDVKLQDITLDQVVDVLYGVQTLPNPVAVSSLQLRSHARDSHSFDADLTCVALAKDG